jgi:uncharacterized protein
VLRVVFDTNMFISALFGGPPEDAFPHVLEGDCTLIVSPPILAGLAGALRQKFRSSDRDITAYVKLIGRTAHVVQPGERLHVVEDDPDNRVLECAVTGRADLIVSGDRHLLRLREHAGIAIVRTVDFLRTLGPYPGRT